MAYCSPAGINVRWQKWQQEKAHPRRFRAAYASLQSLVSTKMRSFQSTVKSLPVFVWYSTNSNQTVSISQGYSPFSAFCLYFVLFSRGCVTNWADTMKSTEKQTFSHRLPCPRKIRHRQSFSSNLVQIPKTKFHFSLLLCRSDKYWWS